MPKPKQHPVTHTYESDKFRTTPRPRRGLGAKKRKENARWAAKNGPIVVRYKDDLDSTG